MDVVRSRLTYANVMATVAVFFALGGGAYAVSLKRNSVGAKQLKTNAVTGVDANEATFGEVPSAATAGNAASAANADLLDSLDSSVLQRLGYRQDTTESPTPNVAGLSVLDFSYSSPTVLTNLPGGITGQVVVLTTVNTNTDVNDAGNFRLQANWTPALDDTLTLTRLVGGLWVEVARSDN
jgi:hypothetical protein